MNHTLQYQELARQIGDIVNAEIDPEDFRKFRVQIGDENEQLVIVPGKVYGHSWYEEDRYGVSLDIDRNCKCPFRSSRMYSLDKKGRDEIILETLDALIHVTEDTNYANIIGAAIESNNWLQL